jgi:hypothetical protein
MPLLRQSKMMRRRKKREPTLAMTGRRYTQEDIAEARSRRLTARWVSNPWKFVVWRAARRGMKLRPHRITYYRRHPLEFVGDRAHIIFGLPSQPLSLA